MLPVFDFKEFISKSNFLREGAKTRGGGAKTLHCL